MTDEMRKHILVDTATAEPSANLCEYLEVSYMTCRNPLAPAMLQEGTYTH